MHIEIHDLYVAAQGMNLTDLDTLCDEHLKIPRKSFVTNEYGNTATYKYAIGNSGESVFISHYSNIDKSFLKLHLHGSFFDNSDFKIRKFLRFIAQFKPTFKQLDLAFNDDKKCLKKKELLHSCKNSGDYCVGSLVTRQPPLIVYKNRRLFRIQLGSARSSANFGTIYKRPDTKFWRIEIKLKDPKKIAYVLENYSDKHRQHFEARSLEVLVSCINFVTARSKKDRDASKYKKQLSWQSFLASDVKRVIWSRINKEKEKNRSLSRKDSFDKNTKRLGAWLGNTISRYSDLHSEEKILQSIAESTGYKLVKRTINDSDDIFAD